MTDALKRAIRTFLQGFVGILAILAIPALNNLITAVGSGERVELDVNLWQGIVIAAIAGGVIALISWGQNALEDATGVKPLRDTPPIDPQDPATWRSEAP